MQPYKKCNLVLILLFVIAFAGCGNNHSGQKPAAGGPPVSEVGIVTVNSEELPMITELPGRINAIRVAEVRARITGIILKKMFEEGADVKAGDVLFQIDPAPLQAIYDSAKANLAKAQAALAQTQSRANRYKTLVEVNAVSKQDYDDATASVLQAEAEIQAAKAAVETASLNLGYATVVAPITGHIGVAKVTEGTLVSQTEATQMAMIQQLDPIYFDFSQSSTEILRLRRSLDQGKLQSIASGEAKVSLLLEDGTVYSSPGKLLFSDMIVNPATGMITLRAQFPNPDNILLPGMFARVKLEQAIHMDAITVPQRGVALGPNGSATAMVVTADNKVEVRPIKLDVAIEDKWIVTEGLKVGDRVIVEGLQKIRPGASVKPVPFTPPSETSAAKPSTQGK
jgi:membrane fusion protein (multidrug efflux system)